MLKKIKVFRVFIKKFGNSYCYYYQFIVLGKYIRKIYEYVLLYNYEFSNFKVKFGILKYVLCNVF